MESSWTSNGFNVNKRNSHQGGNIPSSNQAYRSTIMFITYNYHYPYCTISLCYVTLITFKELLALQVPRSWGSCEIRNTLVDPDTLIAGVIELLTNVVVFRGAQTQSVGSFDSSFSACAPLLCLWQSIAHFLITLLYLHCINILEWKENPFPSVSVLN